MFVLYREWRLAYLLKLEPSSSAPLHYLAKQNTVVCLDSCQEIAASNNARGRIDAFAGSKINHFFDPRHRQALQHVSTFFQVPMKMFEELLGSNLPFTSFHQVFLAGKDAPVQPISAPGLQILPESWLFREQAAELVKTLFLPECLNFAIYPPSQRLQAFQAVT